VGEVALQVAYDEEVARGTPHADLADEFGGLSSEALREGTYDGKYDGYVKDVLARGGFEGNAQTLRVMCYLSARRPIESGARYGLDLTRATLDGSTKYPCLRVHDRRVQRKYGAVESDADVLAWIRADADVGPSAPVSFEAQLMDWCDDVTYAVHDVMDFYRGGSVPLDRLFQVIGGPKTRALSPEAQAFLQEVRAREEKLGLPYDRDLSEAAWLELAAVNDLYEPWRPTLEVKATVQAVTSDLITFLVDNVTFEGDAPCEHQAAFIVDPDEDRRAIKRRACDLLKALLWVYVIDRPALATVQHGQEKIVNDLLRIFASDESLLPEDRRDDIDREGVDLLRAACDHAASLTESDAVALHHRLTGVNLGAITDALQ